MAELIDRHICISCMNPVSCNDGECLIDGVCSTCKEERERNEREKQLENSLKIGLIEDKMPQLEFLLNRLRVEHSQVDTFLKSKELNNNE